MATFFGGENLSSVLTVTKAYDTGNNNGLSPSEETVYTVPTGYYAMIIPYFCKQIGYGSLGSLSSWSWGTKVSQLNSLAIEIGDVLSEYNAKIKTNFSTLTDHLVPIGHPLVNTTKADYETYPTDTINLAKGWEFFDSGDSVVMSSSLYDAQFTFGYKVFLYKKP